MYKKSFILENINISLLEIVQIKTFLLSFFLPNNIHREEIKRNMNKLRESNNKREWNIWFHNAPNPAHILTKKKKKFYESRIILEQSKFFNLFLIFSGFYLLKKSINDIKLILKYYFIG